MKHIGIRYIVAMVLVLWTCQLLTGTGRQAQKAADLEPMRPFPEHVELAVGFERHQTQGEACPSFTLRGAGYDVLLSAAEATFMFSRGFTDICPVVDRHDSFLRIRPIGARPSARVVETEGPGKANYLIGNDPARWRTDVPIYSRVKYEEIYPGIDLEYYRSRGRLEYDFVVRPGARPSDIEMEFDAAGRMGVDLRGNLVVNTLAGEIRQPPPVTYQNVDGRRAVSARYVVRGENRVGFEIGDYDHDRALIIDPVLAYSSYLGGAADDAVFGVAVDGAGDIYVTGLTGSATFPTRGALQPTLNGPLDLFVAKFNAAGTTLEYCTYLGGSGAELGQAIAVDNAGNAYVTGATTSSDFPVVNALQPTFGGGRTAGDAFVIKLNPSGRGLVYATYLGGSDDEFGLAIAADQSGNAYVTGDTRSPNFPRVNPLQSTRGGFNDAFVTEINSLGSAFIYSTLLGGGGDDFGSGIAADSQGNAYITGTTASVDFPTLNPAQHSLAGPQDAFVAKLNPSASELIYSTYLGGNGNENGEEIAIRDRGGVVEAYIAGSTSSTDFPTVGAIQSTLKGTGDAFLVYLSALGDQLYSSTYLGGTGSDAALSVAVDSFGIAYATGVTNSTDFPTVNAVGQRGGGTDVFVVKVSLSDRLIYSTYLGGAGLDGGTGVAVDSSGIVYVAGATHSEDFPRVNPLQSSFGGGPGFGDAFLARLDPDPVILGASVEKKKLLVLGQGFQNGATLFMDDQKQKKTGNDEEHPSTTLVARKSGKKIARGQTVRLVVENPDGTRSPQYFFKRPAD